jgi:hypothetical protein
MERVDFKIKEEDQHLTLYDMPPTFSDLSVEAPACHSTCTAGSLAQAGVLLQPPLGILTGSKYGTLDFLMESSYNTY